jgi:molecular chaperone GrpE
MNKDKKKQNQTEKIEEQEIDLKDTKIKELEEALKRSLADFDNYRKRTETQKIELISFAKADFMTKITPVLDNFGRAFEHLDVTDPKISGIKQIEKQLEDILAQEGLRRISTQGEFNPNLHEAISYEENEILADHIIGEAESGWEFNGKIIKPAKVRVSKGK